MKVTLKATQLNNCFQIIDIALRDNGLKALDAAYILNNRFRQAAEQENEDTYTVELSNAEAKGFQEAIDITIKRVGLKGVEPALELAKLFAVEEDAK